MDKRDVLTACTSQEEPKLAEFLQYAGASEVRIGDRYRIGTTDLFDYEDRLAGKRIKGAGNTKHRVYCTEDMPLFMLPLISFPLGQTLES